MLAISVILPVGPDSDRGYLSEALASISADMSHHDEIIIVLDRYPEEEISSIANEINLPHEQVRILSNHGLEGLCQVLNLGCNAAKHDILARMDADDIVMCGRLNSHRGAFEANPDASIHSVACTGFTTDGKKWPLNGARNHEQLVERLALKNRGLGIIHPAAAFQKQHFLRCGQYREAFFPSEDSDLWMRLLSMGKFIHTPIIGLKYRVHGNSVSAKRRGENFIARLAALTYNWGSHKNINSEADAIQFVRSDFFVSIACKYRGDRQNESLLAKILRTILECFAAQSIRYRAHVKPPIYPVD